MSLRKCRECGKELLIGESDCNWCTTAIAEQRAQGYVCDTCGAHLPDGRACPFCAAAPVNCTLAIGNMTSASVAAIETRSGALTALFRFLIIGPLAGTTPFVLGFIPLALFKGGREIFALPMLYMWGFFIGAIPALFAGALFVALIRRVLRKPETDIPKRGVMGLGAAAGALACLIIELLIGISSGKFVRALLNPDVAFIAIGALASAASAGVCISLTRRCSGPSRAALLPSAKL